MSLQNKQWVFADPDEALQKQLANDASLSPLICNLLINRGITSAKAVNEFINPKISSLSDPFEIPNLRQAAERALMAKTKGEKVMVFGDYDVDGVTATVTVLEALRALGIGADYYIPQRYGEGYGMNLDAVREIANRGYKLIITVDCGISNKKEIELAASLGVDVIVTDHHQLPPELPKAILVDPKMLPDNHSSRDLAGVGVAFKFAWGLFRTAGIKESGALIDLLDLAALGTIADVVPLTRENRILAIQGINVLNQQKRLGLKYLMQAATITPPIGVQEVNFAIAPRLNSAGRLENAKESANLLLSNDHVEASRLAADLNRINTKRQGIGKKILEEVEARIKQLNLDEHQMLILDGEDWHPGVIGIVASKIIDRYSRPTVLIGLEGEFGRGSARSLEGVNIFAALNACRDLFEDFGGHEMAAGFAIKKANIEPLKKKIAEVVKGMIRLEDLKPKLFIEGELKVPDLSLEFAKKIAALGPFGQGNDDPLFVARRVTILDKKTVGSNNNHLKLKISDGSFSQDAIGFGLGHLARNLSFAVKYDVVFTLDTNVWNHNESVQVSLEDLAESRE
jgi:single-stranded-DNA-specific exonuclease